MHENKQSIDLYQTRHSNSSSSASKYNAHRFSVAPMLDWTDRHCRYFHRLLTHRALLFSEMIVSDAIIHGKRDQLLGFSGKEHPVALQLGGADPEKLAEATMIAQDYDYDEINLNVGCPSDRVQSGAFGACLMLEPKLVGQLVSAIKSKTTRPVTVKCRIGVDEQDIEQALDDLAQYSIDAGVDGFWVHARKAWLKGLSAKENREIPPLNYQRVYAFKEAHKEIFVGINGGIETVEEALGHLAYVDGVMMGRQAYYNPALLGEIDEKIYGEAPRAINYDDIIDQMCAYCDEVIANGGRLSHVTRHMIHLFHGLPGAKIWRQKLSTEATQYAATSDIIRHAYAHIDLGGK